MCPVCVRPLQLATMMIGRQRLFRKTRKYWQVFDLNQQWLFRKNWLYKCCQCQMFLIDASWQAQAVSKEFWSVEYLLIDNKGKVWKMWLKSQKDFGLAWNRCQVLSMELLCQWHRWSCFVSNIQWWSCFVSDIQWWSCFVSDIQQFWSCQCGLELVALNRQMF